MYTKEEIAKTRQQFWTAWGLYMKPVPSASGEKVNWTNYKTGVPNIFFRMQAEKNYASVAIELTNSMAELREQQFEQFLQLKNLLQEEWVWEISVADQNGNDIARISAEIKNVNVMNQADWPGIISFLKKNIMALDMFWNDVKPAFE